MSKNKYLIHAKKKIALKYMHKIKAEKLEAR